MNFQKIIGRLGEDKAVEFLESKGLKILARNFHTREGEVDIIARDDQTIIFIEVKTRRSTKFGTAIEAITEDKLEKVVMAGERWLAKNSLDDAEWRIDVVTIDDGVLEYFCGV